MNKHKQKRGGRSGLVVKEGECSEGCGFESQNNVLDGPFPHIFVAKIVMFV